MGDTGCNLVLLGQYNLVLIGIEWYWVNKGLLCLYDVVSDSVHNAVPTC